MKEFINDCKVWFEDSKNYLKDDYIKVGKKHRIIPFSFAWWFVRVLQVLLTVFSFYLIYVLLWILIG